MSVFTASAWAGCWIGERPFVSVAALTEWLFSYVSMASGNAPSGSGPEIAFNLLPEDYLRRQNLFEWWLVLQGGPEENAVKVCRYYVRGAKLEKAGNGEESFSEFPEATRELIEFACRRGAIPLYLFYTDCASASEGKHLSLMNWEDRKRNGCFLENAIQVREKMLVHLPCPAHDILKDASRLSILDRMAEMTFAEQVHLLDPDGTGECFFRGPLPEYVRELMRDKRKPLNRDRMPGDLIPYIRGVGVVNLRSRV